MNEWSKRYEGEEDSRIWWLEVPGPKIEDTTVGWMRIQMPEWLVDVILRDHAAALRAGIYQHGWGDAEERAKAAEADAARWRELCERIFVDVIHGNTKTVEEWLTAYAALKRQNEEAPSPKA